MVMLRVTGAANDAEARTAAKNIAENNLVKCSWYGSDPYWGRLLAAAGSAAWIRPGQGDGRLWRHHRVARRHQWPITMPTR